MVFSSLEFLTLFLPVFPLLCWVAPQRLRNAALLLGRLMFYLFGASVYCIYAGMNDPFLYFRF